jgi:hypothetical protein
MKITGLNTLTTSGYLDINDGLYGTVQSFIVELGFLGVPSDEDHQK